MALKKAKVKKKVRQGKSKSTKWGRKGGGVDGSTRSYIRRNLEAKESKPLTPKAD